MVPPQLARKMSVLSVDPPAPWAPGQIAAGRAHRPGSRRLGGVEAPGASPATGASWPDRRKGWASPGRGPVLRISRGTCVDPIPGALSSPTRSSSSWGRGLCCRRLQRHWPSGFFVRLLRCGVAKKKKFSYWRKCGPKEENAFACPAQQYSPHLTEPYAILSFISKLANSHIHY